jgi:hypothetical protein
LTALGEDGAVGEIQELGRFAQRERGFVTHAFPFFHHAFFFFPGFGATLKGCAAGLRG